MTWRCFCSAGWVLFAGARVAPAPSGGAWVLSGFGGGQVGFPRDARIRIL